MSKKIVVVGGGYAGVLTAKGLIKKFKKEIKKGEVELTLIDKQPYHTLMTELHEAAFDRTNFEAIKVYHKKIFNEKYINLMLDEVIDIDYSSKKITTLNNNLDYDYLVEATGAKVAYFGVEGAEEYSLPMWSYKDSRVVHQKILELFERAEIEPDKEKRKELLTFIVAGAGFSGVEVVGELKEWIDRTLLYKYPTISPNEVSVHIIDGAPRILNSFGEKASKKAHKRMEKKLGINVILNSFITKVTENEVFFGENQSLKNHCLIWTSGITCCPIAPQGYEVQRGNRIPVDKDLQIVGQNDAYVLGDIMYYIPEGEERPVPQMVENCEHAAPLVVNNIVASIKGKGKTKEYNPAFHGAMACIGGRYGVAELKFGKVNLVLSGFFAMFVKHMINIVYLTQAAGFKKVWSYIRVEFFEVRDGRSFIGANLSNSTPSIYLVPMRLWLGWYWISQGAPKVIDKISGGWQAICVNTEVFPTSVKQYGEFCTKVYPQGLAEWTAKFKDTASAATDAATTAVSNAAPVAEAAANTAADAATSATTAVSSTPDVVQQAPQLTGILGSLNSFFEALAPTSTPFGMGYDLSIIPSFLTNFAVDMGTKVLSLMAGFEWLFELIFDFLELILGVLIFLGLFTEFAATALLLLALQISFGSFVNFGVVVEGLFFSIVCAIALLGYGGKGAMPISLDYFLRPEYKKWQLKKRK